jgi:CheY-like chemotaxis protein
VQNGHEALLRIEKESVELVLTDVVMPGMSGQDLAERLKSPRPGTKVLYMSGYAAEIIARHGVLKGGVALIEKPFSPRQLEIKVREVLGEAKSEQPIVLLAEDSAPIRKMLSKILRGGGYAVVEAQNGLQALAHLRTSDVQLALMDVNMPEMGGVDAAREMRREHPGVKIILMSAAIEAAHHQDPALLGVDGLLPKPVTPRELLEAVRLLLLRKAVEH